MSAWEYDAPITLVDLPDGGRSVDGRVRQNGEDERSLLPIRYGISLLLVLDLAISCLFRLEVHTDLNHLLLRLLVSHGCGLNWSSEARQGLRRDYTVFMRVVWLFE
jgi:hypothetical protein